MYNILYLIHCLFHFSIFYNYYNCKNNYKHIYEIYTIK